jgi:hypothetical protein
MVGKSNRQISFVIAAHIRDNRYAMDHVFSLLPKVLRKRGLQEHANSALAVHRAREWVQGHLPHIASCVRVEKVQDSTLVIVCTHSIALQECQGQLSDLQAFLDSECQFAGIRSIKLARK